MKLDSSLGRHCLVIVLLLSLACGKGSRDSGELASASPEPEVSAPTASQVAPADVWWEQLSTLCGNAYAGVLTSEDATDKDLANESMTMHVRRCEENRLEIPFHIGENRSRTWVLTRDNKGLRLQHDHRHEDGSEDVVTLYGGHTDAPGTEVAQDFPVDGYSKELFAANGLKASGVNVWSMEIVPGERFSYILRRPDRHFQVDFDLAESIDLPPAPWGH